MRDNQLAATKKIRDKTREMDGGFRYEWIRVRKVLVPKTSDKLDSRVVAEIAESIVIHGLLHPIAVRRIEKEQKRGTAKGKVILVAGAHRLAAMKLLERKEIACFYIDGDETAAELVRIGENLWRKTLTVLRRAELLVEYLNLASAKVNLSGQVGQKGKVGRPPSGVALAARELPVIGRSEEARRKIIARAIKIACIAPEAKKAAIEARLDNNQKVLLKIAKAGGYKAQVKLVAQLAEIAKQLGAPVIRASKPSATASSDGSSSTVAGPPLQPDMTTSETEAKETDSEGKDRPAPVNKTTTFDEMVVLWDKERRAAWAYLPVSDRERFIEMLHRSKRKARVDVVEFLQDALRGRPRVIKRNLLALAVKRGLSKRLVRMAIKARGYKNKRIGHGWEAVWYVLNPTSDWGGFLPIVSDDELKAAGDSEGNPRDTTASGYDLTGKKRAYKDTYFAAV